MKKQRNEVMVGAFVIVGLIMLALVVFFVSGVYLFRKGYQIHVLYDYVSIIDKGAPVRMAGVRVGEVSEVRLMRNPETNSTRVNMALFIEDTIYIGDAYAFEIRGTHILSEPHIEITPKDGSTRQLKNGDTMEGLRLVPLEDLIQRAQNIALSLDEVVGGLNKTLKEKETSQAMKDIVINLASVTKSLEKVLKGSEDDIKKSMSELQKSTDSLSSILQKVESGEGTVGKLFMDDQLYKELDAFVKDIKKHPWKLLKKDKKLLFF